MPVGARLKIRKRKTNGEAKAEFSLGLHLYRATVQNACSLILDAQLVSL